MSERTRRRTWPIKEAAMICRLCGCYIEEPPDACADCVEARDDELRLDALLLNHNIKPMGRRIHVDDGTF